MPGISHDPGDFAGYEEGRTLMRAVKLHYTAGRYPGDYSVGKRGYFQFYVPKTLPAVQFAEADALCWDSGEWNNEGPGIEFERLDDSEPLTGYQIEAGGRIIRWLHEVWGVPLVFYDGDHDAVRGFSGFVTHRSIPRPNDHVDYIDEADWLRMTAPAAPPKPRERVSMYLFRTVGGARWRHTGARIVAETDATADARIAAGFLEDPEPWSDADLQAERDALAAGSGAAGGPVTVTSTVVSTLS